MINIYIHFIYKNNIKLFLIRTKNCETKQNTYSIEISTETTERKLDERVERIGMYDLIIIKIWSSYPKNWKFFIKNNWKKIYSILKN